MMAITTSSSIRVKPRAFRPRNASLESEQRTLRHGRSLPLSIDVADESTYREEQNRNGKHGTDIQMSGDDANCCPASWS